MHPEGHLAEQERRQVAYPASSSAHFTILLNETLSAQCRQIVQGRGCAQRVPTVMPPRYLPLLLRQICKLIPCRSSAAAKKQGAPVARAWASPATSKSPWSASAPKLVDERGVASSPIWTRYRQHRNLAPAEQLCSTMAETTPPHLPQAPQFRRQRLPRSWTGLDVAPMMPLPCHPPR